jgi:hypothetical protein
VERVVERREMPGGPAAILIPPHADTVPQISVLARALGSSPVQIAAREHEGRNVVLLPVAIARRAFLLVCPIRALVLPFLPSHVSSLTMGYRAWRTRRVAVTVPLDCSFVGQVFLPPSQ